MAEQVTETTSQLQFDTVETSEPLGLQCALCRVPIGDTYFELNGKVACPNCQSQVASIDPDASGPLRFVLATVLGACAGAGGALVWYFVREVTKLEIGLIAIVVGIMVGSAVRKGSGNRGGTAYQVLAVILTYLAIVSANVPAAWSGFRLGMTKAVTRSLVARPPEGQAAAAPDPDELRARVDEIVAHLPLAAWVSIGWFVLKSPFLGGMSNAIGWLIIFFGLQQAWRLTRATPLQVVGPFSLAERGPAR